MSDIPNEQTSSIYKTLLSHRGRVVTFESFKASMLALGFSSDEADLRWQAATMSIRTNSSTIAEVIQNLDEIRLMAAHLKSQETKDE